uniref:Large ribosomal subunit protein uL3c n=1 Tax=Campylaephora sungminbooi TaxID=1896769 RepID=A0A1B0RRN0_9FLOR|nr:ribosomal protein L3 [Campylaephora sungminbooi]AKU47423.1 ribosomal protein L3 [Campylaephora sungminbooi]ALN11870.1 ribosomal protein L3 [Campylaephora sungminbooi]
MTIELLGTKIGMTQIFNTAGSAFAVTILEIGPCFVTQIKKNDKDGYQAIQIGYQAIRPNKLTKAQVGHLKKANLHALKYLHEYKCNNNDLENIKVGDQLKFNQLQIGSLVNISGKNIGKGFSGYQKRHNFSRGPMSHGSKNHRQPGSIGAGTTPGRVFPGKKMAGRMGHKKVTIKNLQIIDINTENNIMIVKGAVPGKPGNIVHIKQK